MESSSKSARIRIAIVAVALAIVAISIGVVAFSNSPSQRVKKQLELGQKYLSELNYEQAVAAFKEAIAIDANNKDAFDGLNAAYFGWGNALVSDNSYERAIQVISEALEVFPDSGEFKEQLVTAYLDWAEYCFLQGDIDEAIRIAAAGYDATGDQRLLDARNKYEERKAEIEKEQLINAFLEKNSEFLDKMFSLLDNQEFAQACEYYWDVDAKSKLMEIPDDIVFDEDGHKPDITGKGYGLYQKEGIILFYCGDYASGKRQGDGIAFYIPADSSSDSRGYWEYTGAWNENKPHGYGEYFFEALDMTRSNAYRTNHFTGTFTDGYQNGSMTNELYIFNGEHALFRYSCDMGVPQDISDQLGGPASDDVYYVALSEINPKDNAIAHRGQLWSVFQFDWDEE